MLKLCVYIPQAHLELVKQALFAAGAGSIGEYSQCCWQVLGSGQFCPSDQAQPFIGTVGQIEQVAEYRVEMLVAESKQAAVEAALYAAHPYETPAYDWVQLQPSLQTS